MSNPWATVGNTPFGLATDGTSIFSANYGDASISQVNIATGAVTLAWSTTSLNTSAGPFNLATYGGYLFCTNQGDSDIARILITSPGTPTYNWGSSVGVTNFMGLAINASNGDMYVGTNAGILKFTNITTLTPISSLFSTQTDIVGIAVDNANNILYCAQGNKIIKLNLLTGALIGTLTTLSLGSNNVGYGLAIKDGYIYSALEGSALPRLIKVRLLDGLTDENWAITGPGQIGVVISGNNIYESNRDDNTIWRINLDAPCFNKGTKILCLNKMMEEEYIPIEDLKKGDLVKSYLHGYRKIDSIGTNKMINNPDHFNLSMYKMEKTDTNGLIEDLIVTGGHSILVDDLGEYYAENEIRFKCPIPKIDDKFFLLCSLSKDFIQLTDRDEYTYYHLVLENNGNNDERFGIWANGILTETISKNQFDVYEQILH
jgi:hypothetical protein